MIEIDIAQTVRKAAAESLERLRQDQQRVTPPLAEALGKIAERAFDPAFRLYDLGYACGHGERWLWRRFKTELACTPKSYLERLRLETAGRLLENPEPPIYYIAEWVGYRLTETFILAFTAWAKEKPRAYRRRRLAEQQTAAKAQATTGEPTAAESPRLPVLDPEIEKLVVEILGPYLLKCSREERIAFATHGYKLNPQVVFECLLEKSREIYHEEPAWSLWLLEEALEILEDLRERLDAAELARLDAEAMACVRLQDRRRRTPGRA